MKRMVCEICDSTNIVKRNEVFECQECGTQYSPEEARKLLKEISDNSNNKTASSEDKQIYNYMVLANESMKSGKTNEAINYANKILEINPNNVFGWYLRAIVEGGFSVEDASRQKVDNTTQYFAKVVENMDTEDVDLVNSYFNNIRQTLSLAYKKLLQYVMDMAYESNENQFEEYAKIIGGMKIDYMEDMLYLSSIFNNRFDNKEEIESKYGETAFAGEENEIVLTPYQFKETYQKVLSRFMYYMQRDPSSQRSKHEVFAVVNYSGFGYYLGTAGLRVRAFEYVKSMYEYVQVEFAKKTGVKNLMHDYLDIVNKQIKDAKEDVEKEYKEKVNAYWEQNPGRKKELNESIIELKKELKVMDEKAGSSDEKKGIDRLDIEIEKKKTELKKLGFFKKAEKEKLNNEINELKRERGKLNTRLVELTQKFKEEKEKINQKITELETQLINAEWNVRRVDYGKEFDNAKPPVFTYAIDSTEIIEAQKENPKKASVIKEAIIGGVIAGPVGAVIGAVHAADKNNRSE